MLRRCDLCSAGAKCHEKRREGKREEAPVGERRKYTTAKGGDKQSQSGDGERRASSTILSTRVSVHTAAARLCHRRARKPCPKTISRRIQTRGRERDEQIDAGRMNILALLGSTGELHGANSAEREHCQSSSKVPAFLWGHVGSNTRRRDGYVQPTDNSRDWMKKVYRRDNRREAEGNTGIRSSWTPFQRARRDVNFVDAPNISQLFLVSLPHCSSPLPRL